MIIKSTKDIKRIFGITDETVSEWVERGIFVKTQRGQFDYDACVIGYVKYKKGQQEKPETLKDKELKKLDLEIEKREMENEERRGNLVDIHERDREFFELARITRDSVLNVIPRVTPQLAHETDEKKTALILETEIKKALKNLSEKLI